MAGPAKFTLGLVLALLATVVGSRIAYQSALPDAESAHAPWATGEMEFVTWNGERWTAWIRAGGFELIPENTEDWHRHSNTTMAFIDWQGEAWQARIEGDEFLLAHRGEWHGDLERSPAIRYLDWTRERKLRTVEQLTR